ncbi:FkbM family methyltransferase [Halorubrum aethiopicum]|uniref:FkbM family methyltransferase n=1 Tax=Halorubrum aethiopicum TaxID=1758255 RepID=UPI0018E3692D|nr:FkbM family methyltransferase [Halorubrum aethiopicum]
MYTLEDTQTHEITTHSVDFHTKTFTEFTRFRDLVGERSIVEDLLTSLDSNDIFYDVGANVGTYTCFAAAKLGPGKVVAFEPEPENADRLRENLELNNLDAEIIQIALSDTDGIVDLALTGDEAGTGEHAIATGDDKQTLEVETARGDSIIEERGLPKPTVAKIDVEGAELSVLRGLRETLYESCRLMYVEVHTEKIRDFGAERSEVETLLTDAGFEVTEISQRGSEIFLRASK